MAADEDFMRLAIAQARAGAAAAGGGPIGCVIVLDGAVVGAGHNEVAASNDATAHAEIVAMRRAGAHLGQPQFRGATLYTTLQPCGMCAMASIWSGIGRIVFGAGRGQVHKMYFEDRHLGTMDFIADAYRDDMRLDGGVLAEDCRGLYYQPGDDPPEEEQANR